MKIKQLAIYIIIALAILQSCSESLVDDLQEQDIRLEDFQITWNIVSGVYPYLEYKKISWDSIYDVYYPKIIQSYSDEYLLDINQMLLELKDGHVNLYLKNGIAYGYTTPRQIKYENRYDFSVTQEYITSNISSLANGKIQYGLISDIGYARVSSFSGYEGKEFVDILFENMKNTQGLIIDVRQNPGGNTNNAMYIVAKCIQEALETPGWVEKGQYSSGIIIQPDSNYNYSKQIVVLVNGKSFSTTEHFASWMKHIEHTTIVGDTTGGGSGNPRMYLLPSGNKIRVSTRFFYKYDGQPIEWNGIVPDILIEQTESDLLAGEDKQLEYAIEFLKKKSNL